MLAFFVSLKFENKLDREINHFNFNSKHYEKCKFALKLIEFLTVSNLFKLEVVQKCQHCQLCVLQKNSIGSIPYVLNLCCEAGARSILDSSPTNAYMHVCGSKWLGHHVGCKEVSRCCTRSESEVFIASDKACK